MAWAFFARLALLTSSPYPLGIDGYFYPLQVRALLDGGELYYPASPMITWLMAPLAAATDPITGAKLGAALAGALAPLPVYLLGRRLGGSRSAGFVAALLVATSAQSFYLGTEFVKNSLGVTAAAGFLCALGWALGDPFTDGRAGRARWLITGLLLAITALTHKLALVVALALAAAPAFVHWRARPRTRRARALALCALIGGLGLVALAGVLAPERFPGARDLALLPGLFDGSLDLTLPTLRVAGNPPLMFQHEVAIAGALACSLLVMQRLPLAATAAHEYARASNRAMATGLSVMALLLCLPILGVGDPQGLGFRLRLMSHLPLALCAAALAGRLCAFLSSAQRGALLLSFAVGFFMARPTGGDEGVVRVHPDMPAAVRAIDRAMPSGDVAIAPERHLMFMAAWYSDRAIRLQPDSGPASGPGSAPAERRWRLLPLAHIDPDLAGAIVAAEADGLPERAIRNLHPTHPRGLLLIHEPTWQRLLSALPEGARARYRRWQTL